MDAPRRLFTSCNRIPPTGGRAGRFGAAVRGGPWNQSVQCMRYVAAAAHMGN